MTVANLVAVSCIFYIPRVGIDNWLEVPKCSKTIASPVAIVSAILPARLNLLTPSLVNSTPIPSPRMILWESSFSSTTTAALIERFSGVLRLAVGATAICAGACGLLSLYQFFKATDEFRQAVNRRAIEFAFIGSLLAAVAIALLRSFGMRDPSPYLIPAVMVAFWSLGLFFSARRFQ